ncbi:hypothetical protein RCC89_14370 [Cytophagaceae bacterium ABcell3]|nr:hypothetical protein RCC89_14370 [Cytophagaceae bacterium ABcell3]
MKTGTGKMFEISKEFPISKEQLYQAWTDTDALNLKYALELSIAWQNNFKSDASLAFGF